MCVASKGRFASKKEMGENLCYPQKRSWDMIESLPSWKMCGGGLLKGGDNCCKKGDWISLLEENKAFPFMVCCVSSTFRHECNNNVQHLYIPQDIKLYVVGS